MNWTSRKNYVKQTNKISFHTFRILVFELDLRGRFGGWSTRGSWEVTVFNGFDGLFIIIIFDFRHILIGIGRRFIQNVIGINVVRRMLLLRNVILSWLDFSSSGFDRRLSFSLCGWGLRGRRRRSGLFFRRLFGLFIIDLRSKFYCIFLVPLLGLAWKYIN